MDEREIEKFLYHEARLMDEHRFEEWLSLWTDDGIYWVPCNHDDQDPTRQVSIIYDSQARLADRISFLRDGAMSAEDARPRIRRTISNIEFESTNGVEATVSSNFLLVEANSQGQNIWGGRSIHQLRQADGGIKIAHKKVLLVNNDQALPVMQFLV
jgi:3-phenylpropionate/cinnamic acid dioxygenase small subunit